MALAMGYVTAVQEERFRLVTDEGRGLLFTLSRQASATGENLCDWHETNTHVTVEYDGSPNTKDGVARAIIPSPPASGAR